MISRKTGPYKRSIKRIDTISCIYEDTKRRFIREGKEKGIMETRIESVKAVMGKLNCSVDEAIDFLDVPASERMVLKSTIDSQSLS